MRKQALASSLVDPLHVEMPKVSPSSKTREWNQLKQGLERVGIIHLTTESLADEGDLYLTGAKQQLARRSISSTPIFEKA